MRLYLPNGKIYVSERKVYHVPASAKNTSNILAEGLIAGASPERGQDLQIADIMFDRVAEKLGIKFRRTGIFAWPSRERAQHQIDIGLKNFGERPILELTIDPNDAIVAHQDFMSLAYTSIWSAITKSGMQYFSSGKSPHRLDMVSKLSGENLLSVLEFVENDPYLNILRRELTPILGLVSNIAELYWKTAVPLSDYDEESQRKLDALVLEIFSRMPKEFKIIGINPLNHEVVIALERIPIEKIKLLED